MIRDKASRRFSRLIGTSTRPFHGRTWEALSELPYFVYRFYGYFADAIDACASFRNAMPLGLGHAA
jgi:hypothetical protein